MIKLSINSLEYINEIAGHRTVPVEVGSKYTDDGWSQKLITINQFINDHVLNCDENKGYLAQHTLFDQVFFCEDIYNIGRVFNAETAVPRKCLFCIF